MVQDAGTSEEWTAKDQKVVVRESDGFNLAIKLNGKLEARPEAVYQWVAWPLSFSCCFLQLRAQGDAASANT